MEHKLKCWRDFFDAVERGDKTFEVRKDDRGFQRDDILVLQKFDNRRNEYVFDAANSRLKIVECRKQVTYILTGAQFGIEPGYVVMGLKDETP